MELFCFVSFFMLTLVSHCNVLRQSCVKAEVSERYSQRRYVNMTSAGAGFGLCFMLVVSGLTRDSGLGTLGTRDSRLLTFKIVFGKMAQWATEDATFHATWRIALAFK